MSALPLKADIFGPAGNVRFVPEADVLALIEIGQAEYSARLARPRTHKHAVGWAAESAIPPIPAKLLRRSETMLCAMNCPKATSLLSPVYSPMDVKCGGPARPDAAGAVL